MMLGPIAHKQFACKTHSRAIWRPLAEGANYVREAQLTAWRNGSTACGHLVATWGPQAVGFRFDRLVIELRRSRASVVADAQQQDSPSLGMISSDGTASIRAGQCARMFPPQRSSVARLVPNSGHIIARSGTKGDKCPLSLICLEFVCLALRDDNHVPRAPARPSNPAGQ